MSEKDDSISDDDQEQAPEVHGPFHRRVALHTGEEMVKARSGQLRWVEGEVNRRGYEPTVDAYRGELPAGQEGYEFHTSVGPRSGTAASKAQWRPGQSGVELLSNGRVAIPCRVTRVV